MLLLGPFALYRDGVPIDTGRWNRSVVVLLKLLASGSRWQRAREELIEILWPDATPEAGASNLRSTLHRLRRALGGDDPSPVLFERGVVSLNRAYRWEVDLDRFEELMRSAGDGAEQLDEAVSLHRGEPLAEHRYDDWAMAVRERVQRLWRDGCLKLARQLAERGESDAAVQRLESVLDHDPLDEEAIRALLCVLSSVGRRTEALKRFQQFERRLNDDMAISPEPETMAVVRQLQTATNEVPTPMPVGRHPAPTPFAQRREGRTEADKGDMAADMREMANGASRGRTRGIALRTPRSGTPARSLPERRGAIVGASIVLALLAVIASIPVVSRLSGTSRATTVYRLAASWSDLDRAPGSFRDPRAIALDRQANVYVADTGNRRIQKISAAGEVLAQWKVKGEDAVIQGVAVDGQDHVYVADGYNNRILRYSSTGRFLTQWGKEGFRPGEFNDPSALAIDAHDNLYVVDTENGRVQKLSPQGKVLAELGFPFAGNPPLPSGVAVDRQGNVYAAEMFTRSVYQFSPRGKLVGRRALPRAAVGDGTRPIGVAVDMRGSVYVADSQSNRILKLTANRPAQGPWGSAAGQFRSPQGVAVGVRGDIYVADTGNNRIQKLSPTRQPLGQWGSGGSHFGRLHAPTGVAVDATGDVYVADTGNNRVVRLSPQGQIFGHWGTELTGLNHPFLPSSVAVGTQGDVYVAELDGWIERLSSTGTPLARWGRPGSPFRGLVCPCQVATDARGHVYVTDVYGWGKVRQFSSTGRLRRTFTAADPGVIRTHHSGIALDRHGDIYLTDGDTATVTKLSPAGKFLSRWGKRGDRPGDLSNPQEIAVDASGDVYVADTENSLIEKFSANGAFLTSIGKEGSGPGRLHSPQGVAVDADGNVYVADTGNDRVVAFAPEG